MFNANREDLAGETGDNLLGSADSKPRELGSRNHATEYRFPYFPGIEYFNLSASQPASQPANPAPGYPGSVSIVPKQRIRLPPQESNPARGCSRRVKLPLDEW